jgi:hypothetical protein
MTKEEREMRVKELWMKAYHKARGASILLNTFENL